jgi:SNF2 family DNA or RNA helicase
LIEKEGNFFMKFFKGTLTAEDHVFKQSESINEEVKLNILSRKKEDYLQELNNKTEIFVEVDLTQIQRKYYLEEIEKNFDYINKTIINREETKKKLENILRKYFK